MTTETPESAQAVIVRTYCESKFAVGQSLASAYAITGEPYITLTNLGFPTLEAVREAAQAGFDYYAKDKSGILYWRTVPEIAWSNWPNGYSYYMRLLISDKPRKS